MFFADHRGWTSFVDAVEPKELMRVLREFHDVIGRLVKRATVGFLRATLPRIVNTGATSGGAARSETAPATANSAVGVCSPGQSSMVCLRAGRSR
jgi:class 3 adenylate cyclase